MYYGEHDVLGFVGEGGEKAKGNRLRARTRSTNSGCGRGGCVQSARMGGGVRPAARFAEDFLLLPEGGNRA